MKRYLLCQLIVVAAAAQPSRIAAPLDESKRVVLAHHVAPQLQGAEDMGPLPASAPLSSMVVLLKRTAQQQQALEELLVQQQDPKSPNYHRWLTPAQFADEFGLNSDDYAKVTSWLEGQGFQIERTANARNWVMFNGTHLQVTRAFHTEIHNFQANGDSHYANVSDPEIPAALSDVVAGIHGLHNFEPPPATRQTLQPRYVSAGQTYLGPADLAAAYDFQALWDAGIKGDGVSIAVIGRANFQMSDIIAYRNLFGLPLNLPQTILAGANPGSSNAGDVTEAELDLEIAGGVAPDASIKYVNSNSVITSTLYAIDNNVAPIITYSYGICEQQSSISPFTWQGYIQQANALGITFFASSGDAGPAVCDYDSSSATHGITVGLPASIPEVTAVGGTQITSAGTNNNRLESAWDESGLTGSTTGGPSAYFSKPLWQNFPGVPSDAKRDVPDIAFSAAYLSGDSPYAICLNGGCQSGQVRAVGGTSASSPVAAGAMALVTQYQMAHSALASPGLGNINPALYRLAYDSPFGFTDVLVGTNYVSCTSGTRDCPSGQFGYWAGANYDLTTGLGSLDVYTLAQSWNLSSNRATSTIAVSPAVGLCSGTLVYSATVTTGAPSVSGQVTFYRDYMGDKLGTVSVSSAGPIATASIWFTPGYEDQHIHAVYSGDNSSLGSVSPETVVSVQGGKSLSLSTSSAAVTQGVPVTFNTHFASVCGPAAETVTLYNSFQAIASGTPDASGNLSLTLNNLAPGFYNITASTQDVGAPNSVLVAVSTPGAPIYSVQPLAGLATQSCSGDGGPATQAGLGFVNAIAVDSQKNLYIADRNCQEIRKVDTSGKITSYLAGITPIRLAIGPDDIVYFSAGQRVYEILNGQAIAVAGSGAVGSFQGDGVAALQANLSPSSIGVAPDGALFLVDTSVQRVFKVSNGVVTTVVGGGFYTPAEGVVASQTFNFTGDISVDAQGTLWAFWGFNMVGRIGADDIIHVVPTSSVWGSLYAINPQGDLFVLDTGSLSPRVVQIVSGQPVYLAGGSTGIAQNSLNGMLAGLFNGAGLAVDSSGQVYFASSWNVQIIRPYSATLKTPLRFVPVAPCRVADTRNNDATFGGYLPAQTSRSFSIPASSCNIPTSAQAYSLNVTAVPRSVLNYLTVWPTNLPQPLVSTLNSDGRVKANAVVIRGGDNNGVSVFATDPTDVILDINGYFVPAASAPSALAFYPLAPCRVADTRFGVGALAGPSLAAGVARAIPVRSSSCGVPQSAQAYSLNFTAIPHGPLGFLSTWPSGASQPWVSTLNSPTGAVTANAAIVPAGPDGGINVYASNDADVAIDINGYFAPPAANGLSLYTVLPCRPFDSRFLPGAGQPFNGSVSTSITGANCGAPSTAQAFVLNATVVPSQGLSFLTLWPDGQAKPWVSTLNAEDGAVTSNFAIVPSANGWVDAFSTNPTQLILDISGYFAP